MTAEYWATRDRQNKDTVFKAEAEDTLATVSVYFEEQRLSDLLRRKAKELTDFEPAAFLSREAPKIKPDCQLVKQLFPEVEVNRAWVQTLEAAVLDMVTAHTSGFSTSRSGQQVGGMLTRHESIRSPIGPHFLILTQNYSVL